MVIPVAKSRYCTYTCTTTLWCTAFETRVIADIFLDDSGAACCICYFYCLPCNSGSYIQGSLLLEGCYF